MPKKTKKPEKKTPARLDTPRVVEKPKPKAGTPGKKPNAEKVNMEIRRRRYLLHIQKGGVTPREAREIETEVAEDVRLNPRKYE